MSKDYYKQPDACGFCGMTLDIDAHYQGRKFHRYSPNCQSKHNQFLAKMRKSKKSNIAFIRDFALEFQNKIDAGVLTERDVDPLLSIVNINKFLPLTGKQIKKKVELLK